VLLVGAVTGCIIVRERRLSPRPAARAMWAPRDVMHFSVQTLGVRAYPKVICKCVGGGGDRERGTVMCTLARRCDVHVGEGL
jgi:hypothetical protein